MFSTLLKFYFLFTLNGISDGIFTPDHATIMYGSDDTTMEEFGYKVSLKNPEKDHFCAGVIISEKHIVTAAHCLYFKSLIKRQPKQLTVVAGELYLNATSNFSIVSKIVVHEKYNQNGMTNDIAILELQRSLDLDNNPNISKCELNTEITIQNKTCIITGWGETATGTGTPSNKLRKSTINIITQEECQMKYKKHKIVESMVCGEKDNYATIAKGDSGGGLLCDAKVTGITSVSDGNCPAVFTNISCYYDWIQNNTRRTEKYLRMGIGTTSSNKERNPESSTKISFYYDFVEKETTAGILVYIIKIIYLFVLLRGRFDIINCILKLLLVIPVVVNHEILIEIVLNGVSYLTM